MEKKSVLTIGGSDPSCGAGIQADIRTLQLLSIHPLSVTTAVTIQNTESVKEVLPLPVQQIEKQIDHLMIDCTPSFVKTGLLYQAEVAELIKNKVEQYNWKLIIDPILQSTSGMSFSSSNYLENLKKLIPSAFMITPNIPEANKIINEDIKTIEDMKNAAKKMVQMGCKTVLIKGGHLNQSGSTDVFCNGKDFSVFTLPKIKDKQVHGSGCVLSSLISGFLAKKELPEKAVQKAKHALWLMIMEGYQPGKGMDVSNLNYSIFNQSPPLFKAEEHMHVWMEMYHTNKQLQKELSKNLIAEVGCNLGYATSIAKEFNDICALKQRIMKTSATSDRYAIDFGASKHVASIILAAMKKFPTLRCAMNIKYDPEIINACHQIKLNIASFDRLQEPPKTSSTMEWGTTEAIKKLDSPPTIIYDTGSVGKEPMIRVLGKTPDDVLKTIISIKTQLNKSSSP